MKRLSIALILVVIVTLTAAWFGTLQAQAPQRGGATAAPANAAPAEPTLAEPTLAERQERIRTWQQELERKKAALKPYDAVAQAAFDKELNEYLAELKKVKDDMAKTGP